MSEAAIFHRASSSCASHSSERLQRGLHFGPKKRRPPSVIPGGDVEQSSLLVDLPYGSDEVSCSSLRQGAAPQTKRDRRQYDVFLEGETCALLETRASTRQTLSLIICLRKPLGTSNLQTEGVLRGLDAQRLSLYCCRQRGNQLMLPFLLECCFCFIPKLYLGLPLL